VLRRVRYRLTRTARAPRRWLIVALGVNLVAALLAVSAVGYLLFRPLGQVPQEPILILGEERLREEAERQGVPAGQPAPGVSEPMALALTDLDGRPFELAELRGRPVWIVFWATYCHACQEEEPDLRRAYAAYRPDGLVVVALDAGEPADDVQRYVEERGLPWTVVLDPELRAYDAYGAIGTPTHYFIDPEGRIVSRAFGRLRLAEMRANVATILGRTR
jgi:thiol-disulfide isomerase/thioredoxin